MMYSILSPMEGMAEVPESILSCEIAQVRYLQEEGKTRADINMRMQHYIPDGIFGTFICAFICGRSSTLLKFP